MYKVIEICYNFIPSEYNRITSYNVCYTKLLRREIIQDDLNEENVKNELEKLLNNQDYRINISHPDQRAATPGIPGIRFSRDCPVQYEPENL